MLYYMILNYILYMTNIYNIYRVPIPFCQSRKHSVQLAGGVRFMFPWPPGCVTPLPGVQVTGSHSEMLSSCRSDMYLDSLDNHLVNCDGNS